MTLTRNLAWRDKYVEFLQQTLSIDETDCEINPFFALDEENNYILLKLSEQQFIQIFSALMTGADLTYPEMAHQVVWDFVKGINCPMDLCQLILTCMETTPEIQQFLTDYFNNQSNTNIYQSAQNQLPIEMAQGYNPTCDLDILWGGINNAIEQANQNNIDVLDIFETNTNILEISAELIDNGGENILSTVMASIVDLVQYVQDNIVDSYDGLITTAYLNEIKCDLFCLMKNDCIVTAEIITQYFYDRLSSGLATSDTFLQMVTFIISGTWSGTQLADLMFMSQFGSLAMLGVFFETVGFNNLALNVQLGMLEPSSAWTLLCECSELWTHTFDFTIDDGGFEPQDIWSTGDNAVYINGVGWSYTNTPTTGDYRRTCIIQREFDTTNILSASMTYNLTKGTNSASLQSLTAINSTVLNGATLLASDPISFLSSVTGDDQEHEVTLDNDANKVGFNVSSSIRTSAVYTGNALITSATLTGFGVNPFE